MAEWRKIDLDDLKAQETVIAFAMQPFGIVDQS